MVGAAGIVASTINNRHQRRESRSSQHGDINDHHQNLHGRAGSKATISDGCGGGGGGRASSSCYRDGPPSYTRPGTGLSRGDPGGGGGGGGGVTPSGVKPSSSCTGDPNNTSSSSPSDPELIAEKLSLGEQVKFYVSLALGIVASLCVFALLFLIPLVVEPSISTLLADFDPSAATCVTVDHTLATGLSKCGLWASCREGCTSTPSQCHQIYVSYRKANKPGAPPIHNFTILDSHDWLVSSLEI
jgi:hypothetical protein